MENGVAYINKDLCDKSHRLYNSRNAEAAHLIDVEGNELHSWEYRQGGDWHYVEMLDNGHLLAICKDCMLIELDWDSELVWKFETNAHHDFARKEDGNTYIVSGRPNSRCEALAPDRPLYLDNILEVTPAGEVVWQWYPEEHIEEMERFVELVDSLRFWDDWPHLNTCEVLPDSPTARKDSRFAPGNLLVCGRHIDTIAVVARQTGEVMWAWGSGELQGPHMPTMLPNGNILIYDNGSNWASDTRGKTHILELDPITEEIVWTYKERGGYTFFSSSRGSSERLPNGNIYIAESNSGRLFEVTRDGELVWEFLNPDRDDKGYRVPIYRSTHCLRETVSRLLSGAAAGGGGSA